MQFQRSDARYVRQHNLGGLISDLLDALKQERPANMKEYVVQFLKKRVPVPQVKTCDPIITDAVQSLYRRMQKPYNPQDLQLQVLQLKAIEERIRKPVSTKDGNSSKKSSSSSSLRDHLVALALSLPEDKVSAGVQLIESLLRDGTHATTTVNTPSVLKPSRKSVTVAPLVVTSTDSSEFLTAPTSSYVAFGETSIQGFDPFVTPRVTSDGPEIITPYGQQTQRKSTFNIKSRKSIFEKTKNVSNRSLLTPDSAVKGGGGGGAVGGASPGVTSRRIAVSAKVLSTEEMGEQAKAVTRHIEKTPEEEENLRTVLLANPLFSTFEKDGVEIERIVKAMEREVFKSGYEVLSQGKPGNHKMYLMISGKVDVLKKGKKVHQFVAGCTFGELELIQNSPTCEATILCVNDVVAYSLDQESYQSIILQYTLDKRKKFREVIDTVKIFSDLPDYNKMCLAEALTTARFEANEYLIRFGQKVDHMYLIIQGRVKVMGRRRGQIVEICTLEKGSVIGELEFLFGKEAVADVIALEHVRTAQLTKQQFELILGPVTSTLKLHIAQPEYDYFRTEGNTQAGNEIQSLSSSLRNRTKEAGGASGVLKPSPTRVIKLPASPKNSDMASTTKSKAITIEEPGGDATTYDPPAFFTPVCDTVEDAKPTPTANPMQGSDLIAVNRDDVIPLHHVPLLPEGEVVYPVEIGEDGLMGWIRFPLEPLDGGDLALFGLREDGTILHWSATMFKVLLYDAEDVVGSSVYSLLADASSQEAMNAMITAAVNDSYTPGDEEACQLHFSRKDSSKKVAFNFHIVASRVSQERLGVESPEVLLAVGFEVKAARVDMWLPHQLKIPIANILSNLDEIQTSNVELNETLAQIRAQCEVVFNQLDSVTQSRKNFGLEGSETFSIWNLVGETITTMSGPAAAKNIKMTHTIASTVPSEVMLPVSITEIISHICNNSIKALDKGVLHIAVETEQNPLTGQANLRFVFSDNGPGIAPDIVERVMTKPIDVGATSGVWGGKSMRKGMGLCRVHGLVKRVGGKLVYEETPGGGATWVVSVALIDPRAGSPITPSLDLSTFSIREDQSFTTLLVEDVVHRNMLCHVLWDRKHAVVPGSTWEDVLRFIDNVDIVIINPDVFPPESNIDIGTLFEQRSKKISFILSTGNTDFAGGETVTSAGIMLLEKPCTVAAAHEIFMKAEDRVATQRAETQRMTKLRETITKEYRGAWERVKLLGQGAFSAVYQVKDVLTQGLMAMKVIKITQETEAQIMSILSEIEVMTMLQHDNVVQYFRLEKGEGELNIFMEFASGGALDGYITEHRGTPLSANDIADIVRDIVEGLRYVHSQHVVHCDIKPPNILKSATGNWKLGDFGTAKKLALGEKLHDTRGTYSYMAPEVMEADPDHGYGFECDIWSVGCVVMELASGKPPWYHISKGGNNMAIVKYLCELEDDPDLACIFDSDPTVFEFVRMCLRKDPSKRATLEQLMGSNLLSHSKDAVTLNAAIRIMAGAKLLHRLEKFQAFHEPAPNERGDTHSQSTASIGDFQSFVSPPVVGGDNNNVPNRNNSIHHHRMSKFGGDGGRKLSVWKFDVA
eukprot:PhF_6_TR27974/c0_g1_i1/m.41389